MVNRLLAICVSFLAAAAALASPDAAPPALRLPQTASPTGYRVALTIDPAKPSFRGSVDIGIRLAAPTELLWLHGTELRSRRRR